MKAIADPDPQESPGNGCFQVVR